MGWMSKPVAGEGHITILGPSYDSIGQGVWENYIDPDQCLNLLTSNNTEEDGDNLSYKVYLDAGTYTLRLLTELDPCLGILDIDINDTEVASFDTYAADCKPNTLKTQTGIVITTPGLYTIRCRVDGKNEEASSYIAVITYITLWRTA